MEAEHCIQLQKQVDSNENKRKKVEAEETRKATATIITIPDISPLR